MSRISGVSLFFTALLLVGSIRAEVPAGAVWIDVRSVGEYVQDHLQQAKLIPFDKIEAKIDSLQLASDTPIYLYCAVGVRAEVARESLLSLGYTNVTNAGGLEDARRLAGHR